MLSWGKGSFYRKVDSVICGSILLLLLKLYKMMIYSKV